MKQMATSASSAVSTTSNHFAAALLPGRSNHAVISKNTYKISVRPDMPVRNIYLYFFFQRQRLVPVFQKHNGMQLGIKALLDKFRISTVSRDFCSSR